ncbi:MAG TPA: DUF1385 domain-containing protein [Acidimicrobiia bacterium]|nr:DUF1385 domain-containing protein [Acidimicrobiia bacterium]
MSEHIDPAKTVGGQAVIEGVMMRAPTAWSVAVRQPDERIVARRSELPRLSSRSVLARVPFVRGILVLAESLSLGFRALSWSAQKAAGEEEEPLSRWEIGSTMAIAFVIFAGLFILLPAGMADVVSGENDLLFGVVEGVLRLLLFVGYIWLIGRSEEIGRVFEFHGAEHMSIYAYEAGEPLSIESVRRYPPEHPRCGTSFLMIVVLGSILLFSFLGQHGWVFLVASRLLGIPLIAAGSYELLRFSGTRGGGLLANALATPGLWLQKLTTRVPVDDQIEVAIASLVVALDEVAFAEATARGGIPAAAIEVRREVFESAFEDGL